MKLKISLLLFLFVCGFTLQAQARTLIWKPSNPKGSTSVTTENAWTVEGTGEDATFQTGDNLVYGAHDSDDIPLTEDITVGNITYTSGSTKTFWLAGGGHYLGNGTVTVDMGFGTNAFITIASKIYENFEGNFILDSCNYVQVGSGTGGGVTTSNRISIGNSITVNSGSALRMALSGNVTEAVNRAFVTKVILNDGAKLQNNNSCFGFNLAGGLEIGAGSNGAVWEGTTNGKTGISLTISGELTGGADSIFILNGPTDNASTTVNTINLTRENSYSGILQVNAYSGKSANELHLKHALAAQYATIELDGGGDGGTGVARAGQAVLSVDAASSMVAGLKGNANSLVTSTVASTLTVKSGDYNGMIEDGAGLALVKSGAGTLTLGNVNTYAGGTTITEGTLVAANAAALGTGNVVINGGTLQTAASNLTLGGSLTMTSGSIVLDASAPVGGGGVGTPMLTLTDMFVSGGAMTLNMYAGGDFQSILSSSNGTLSLTDGFVLTINMAGYTDATEETIVNVNDFFQGFGSMTIDYANVVQVINPDGLTGTVNADGTITFGGSDPVIPEPTTTALFALAACGLFGRRNRKVTI